VIDDSHRDALVTGTRTRTIELGSGRSVEVTLAEAGTGRTALVLHGPAAVALLDR
jgi:hypothetical protein